MRDLRSSTETVLFILKIVYPHHFQQKENKAAFMSGARMAEGGASKLNELNNVKVVKK